ncbi:CopG family transcriptional regulator [Halobacteriales archaeon QS_1_68_20]|nr:MAG: CopG family transcriptional regulator [Halobacteriales archaeon QS_1_68_20]
MSTDAEEGSDDGRMEKIDVRVPSSLLNRIDEEYERRGYSSRSEAIRDALRDWVDPQVQLSEEVLADLAVSRQQAELGETTPLETVMEKYGVEPDE